LRLFIHPIDAQRFLSNPTYLDGRVKPGHDGDEGFELQL
jgi:hypothetical protein